LDNKHADRKITLMRLCKEAQLTLPVDVRKAFNVKQGDYLEAVSVLGAVLVRPVTIAHRKDAWKSIIKAVRAVRDTKPKRNRDAKAGEAAIVREIKAHRRAKHA
jgi:bifunctional DNA-binding transcriptional regulator/antitoxin component of YhaV-PrlF toxin-antitoxin module